jgi:hypothetical protein
MFTTPAYSIALPSPRDRIAAGDDAPLILIVDDEQGILRATERGLTDAIQGAVRSARRTRVTQRA